MISVIVPVYNVEKVLHYCIDSILNQTYSDFELILVDDGSSDNSGKICDEYAKTDDRIFVIHKDNEGVSSARNMGIENAKGEYLCFVDSDDYVDSYYLEGLMNLKSEYSDFNNIWCGLQTVDAYKNANVSQNVVFSEKEKVSVITRKNCMDLHDSWLDAGPCCKLYLVSLIRLNNLKFDKDISLGEDLLFNYQYLNITNGKIAILNQALYNYYTNGVSLTSKFHKDLFDKYQIIHSAIRQFMISWGCDSKQMSKFSNACFYIYEFVLRNTFHQDSTIKNKIKYNNQIMKSDEFQNTFSQTDCYIHPIYRVIYEYHLSWCFRFLM